MQGDLVITHSLPTSEVVGSGLAATSKIIIVKCLSLPSGSEHKIQAN